MSSDVWYQIRSVDPDSTSLKYTLLLNKLNIAQFAASTNQDIKRPKALNESSQSTVGVRDPFAITKLKQVYQPFELSAEPDKEDCKCHVRFDHINDKVFDLSLWENHALLEGIPKMATGIDDGVVGLYLSTRINYDIPAHLDYAHIPFTPSLDISAMPAGFTVISEFVPCLFAQHNGADPTIAEYSCVSDASEYFALRHGVDGKVKWFVRDEGVTYDHITPEWNILKAALYMVAGTYDPLATPRVKLYINGVLTTDASTESANEPNGADDDIYIGISNTLDKGAMCSTHQEFWLYDRALTATEIANLWFNKRSISAGQFGRFAVPGYLWIPPTPVPAPDFDTNDFDSNDFN